MTSLYRIGLFGVFITMSACSSITKVTSSHPRQSFKNIYLNQKRTVASESNNPFNNEDTYQRPSTIKALLRKSLEKAAQKYYQSNLTEAINKKLFSSKLQSEDLDEVNKRLLDFESKAYHNLVKKLDFKYRSILNTTIEDYDGQESLFQEMHVVIHELYATKDVQDEMIENVFSEKQKELLSKYISLVKKILKDLSGTIVENRENGVSNFNDMMDRTFLFIPSKEYLANFYEKGEINNKEAYILMNEDRNGKEMNDSYGQYFKSGTLFYTTYNAAVGVGEEGVDTTLYV